MYAWKCWRDSRRVFLAFTGMYLIPMLVILVIGTFRHHPRLIHSDWEAWRVVTDFGMTPILFAILTAGAPASEFLLTRPISRSRLILTGFGVSLAQFTTISALLGFLVLALSSDAKPLSTDVSTFRIIALTVFELILAAAILRSLFVITPLIPRRRWPIYASILLSLPPFYLFTAAIYPSLERWTPWFPSLLPNILVRRGNDVTYMPHIWQDFLIRGILVLMFLFVAQKMLERREV